MFSTCTRCPALATKTRDPIFASGQDVCSACVAKGLKAKEIFEIEMLPRQTEQNIYTDRDQTGNLLEDVALSVRLGLPY